MRNGNDRAWNEANQAIANQNQIQLINALENLMQHTGNAVDMLPTFAWMTQGQMDRIRLWNSRC